MYVYVCLSVYMCCHGLLWCSEDSFGELALASGLGEVWPFLLVLLLHCPLGSLCAVGELRFQMHTTDRGLCVCFRGQA